MTILIVDDEKIMISHFRSILVNSSLEIEEIYEAQNADDAMKCVEVHNPDIVLSDIRMSVTDGLTLAKHIHEEYPAKQIILVTGYFDFEYAQSAIRNGIFDYILKPVKNEELISSVSRAYEKMQMLRQKEQTFQILQDYFENNSEIVKKQYIESLLFTRLARPRMTVPKKIIDLPIQKYRLCAIRCGTLMDTDVLEGEYYCAGLTEQYLQSRLPDSLTHVLGNIVFLIWKTEDEDPVRDADRLSSFLDDLSAYARQNLFGKIEVGISPVCDSLDKIQQMRKLALKCLEDDASPKDETRIVFSEDLVDTPKQLEYDLDEDLNALELSVRSGNEEQAMRCFDSIVSSAAGTSENYLKNAFLMIISHLSFMAYAFKVESEETASTVNSILILSTKSIEIYTETLRKWILSLCKMMSSDLQQRNHFIVNKVQEFINENYSRNIGLAEAARHVGRNPSYISRLVKEVTGRSFVQILTEKRIYEAKQLLKNTNLKITEIAEQTGYPNVRYFNRVFKANTNMSANDYRKFTVMFQE